MNLKEYSFLDGEDRGVCVVIWCGDMLEGRGDLEYSIRFFMERL